MKAPTTKEMLSEILKKMNLPTVGTVAKMYAAILAGIRPVDTGSNPFAKKPGPGKPTVKPDEEPAPVVPPVEVAQKSYHNDLAIYGSPEAYAQAIMGSFPTAHSGGFQPQAVDFIRDNPDLFSPAFRARNPGLF